MDRDRRNRARRLFANATAKLEDAAYLAAVSQSPRRSLRQLAALARRLERQTAAVLGIVRAISALTGGTRQTGPRGRDQRARLRG